METKFEVNPNGSTNATDNLLAEAKRLDELREARIIALLGEREKSTADHEANYKRISSELKALGYNRAPRGPRAPKPDTVSRQQETAQGKVDQNVETDRRVTSA